MVPDVGQDREHVPDGRAYLTADLDVLAEAFPRHNRKDVLESPGLPAHIE
jgi:hypothetical protein